MSPPTTASNNSEEKTGLYTTPLESYAPARKPPSKLIGVEAALKAAQDPTFEVKSSLAEEMSLSGRAAVVTGAAAGIGLEYCITLAEMGANVYAMDLKDQPGEDFLASKAFIKKLSNGGSLDYVKADVTDEESVSSVINSVVERHGGLHVCVANAGILGPVVDCHEYPADWFRKIMDVNVTGVFLTMKVAAKVMVEKEIKGSIIATASMSGSIINKDMHWVPYTTSKAAVIQMAKAFASELGRNEIRVNTISPGHIRTRMTEAYLDVEPLIENNWAAQNPMGRLGAVFELRGAIAYLASDMSTYMTGNDLQVCGGHTAW